MQRILVGAGLPEEAARQAAEVLLDAEISGVESHGLMRLAGYVDRISNGLIESRPDIRIETRDAVATVDGGNGLGQVVAHRAAEVCGDLARRYGIGVVTVRNSNHFGTAAYYSRLLSKQGCIGFSASLAGPTIAPFGGMDLLLGTNPFSVAFPAKDMIFCADMATSAAAKGKIRIYDQKGLELPKGWALDQNGFDTTDPKEAINGILLPMAGHKGYALAMVVDTLCGLLSGAALSGESSPMFQNDRNANTGHFFGAIHIDHFLPEREFADRARTWFAKLQNSRPRPGGPRVMIPGQPEDERRAASDGSIRILDQTLQVLKRYESIYANTSGELS